MIRDLVRAAFALLILAVVGLFLGYAAAMPPFIVWVGAVVLLTGLGVVSFAVARLMSADLRGER